MNWRAKLSRENAERIVAGNPIKMLRGLSPDRLRELLHYDPGTGLFTWIANRAGKAVAGSVAGCVGKKGYVSIYVDGVPYRAPASLGCTSTDAFLMSS